MATVIFGAINILLSFWELLGASSWEHFWSTWTRSPRFRWFGFMFVVFGALILRESTSLRLVGFTTTIAGLMLAVGLASMLFPVPLGTMIHLLYFSRSALTKRVITTINGVARMVIGALLIFAGA